MPSATCQICTTEFYVKPSHLERGWGKYCSIKCRTQAQYTGKQVHCFTCGKEIYRSITQTRHSKSGMFFCNKSCKTKWKNTVYREERHPNWLSGIRTYRNILLRTGKEQICNCCKLTDTRVLIVHHIDHDRKNNDESNLIWVCMNCHFLIHSDREFEYKFKKNL